MAVAKKTNPLNYLFKLSELGIIYSGNNRLSQSLKKGKKMMEISRN